MKRQFFDTYFSTTTGLSTHTSRVLRYMVENRDKLITTEDLYSLVHSIRNILKTPMAEFFDRIVSYRKLHNFAVIHIPKKEISIPEMLTYDAIALDLKQFPSNSAIMPIKELHDKILVNATSTTRWNPQQNTYEISATDVFQNIIARGQLVASYNDMRYWLSSYLSEFVVKSYSMILSGIISRYFNLSLMDTLKVMGICALYMAQMLTPDDDDQVCPPLYLKCSFIGSRDELVNLAKECEEESRDGLTVEKMCKLISTLVTERIKVFNMQAFNMMCCNLGPDQITSKIAMEYPPYWLYILLLAMSGAKIPLIYQMNQQRLTQEGRSKFLAQLYTYEPLYSFDRR